MKGRRSIFLKKKLQSVIFKLVVEDTALHAYHNPLQIVAQMDDEVSRRGKGKRWTLLQTFPSVTLMASFCEERSYSKGRKTVSSDSRTQYLSCSIKGSTKIFRAEEPSVA